MPSVSDVTTKSQKTALFSARKALPLSCAEADLVGVSIVGYAVLWQRVSFHDLLNLAAKGSYMALCSTPFTQ